jgi:translation elongation factor EF-G
LLVFVFVFLAFTFLVNPLIFVSQINIIDTFKHVDFTIDVQRALHFFDGAILVLSSVSGVHMKSTDVDQHMKSYEIPRLVFIDKLDKKGANPWVVLNQVNLRLMRVIVLVLSKLFCFIIN